MTFKTYDDYINNRSIGGFDGSSAYFVKVFAKKQMFSTIVHLDPNHFEEQLYEFLDNTYGEDIMLENISRLT